MNRLYAFFAAFAVTFPAFAVDPPAPLAEKYLHEGKFAEGESASLHALDINADDEETRFGLGVIQFARAVENLGKALYEYGAFSEKSNAPFLRLPVPRNDHPSTISYKAFGRILDAFANDLARAEATLAGIRDDHVKLRLRLAKITFDFTGTGKDRTSLISLITKVNDGRFGFQKDNPEFRVHFDRGDVAWLRGYCHLLSAMVEIYRAIDEEPGFEARVSYVFPNIEKGKPVQRGQGGFLLDGLSIVDPPRLRRFRLHLVSVCELNRETWRYIMDEKDDDFEWLPNPKQSELIGLPISKEQIDGWLAMMDQLEGVLKGKRLISGQILSFLNDKHKKEFGLNVKKVLDDPPADLLNIERIRNEGIDAKYLEPEKKKAILDLDMVFNATRLFDGPHAFSYAARFN